MESPMYSPHVPATHPHHSDSDAATRPSLGFPLGTALLLVVIFSLSGIFSCCYHWDKFRSLRRSYDAAAAGAATDGDLETGNSSDEKGKINDWMKSENTMQSLPVIMPGDVHPKFIALPCPCQPLRPDTTTTSIGEPPFDLKTPKPLTPTTTTTTAVVAMTSPPETTPPP